MENFVYAHVGLLQESMAGMSKKDAIDHLSRGNQGGEFPHLEQGARGIGATPLFAVLNALWDLMFSPMADADRLIMGLIAAVILIHLRGSEQWPLPDARPRPELSPRKPKRSYGADYAEALAEVLVHRPPTPVVPDR